MPKHMDPLLVAEKEVSYISTKYRLPIKEVRKAVKKVGVSRVKVMEELARMELIIIHKGRTKAGRIKRTYDKWDGSPVD